MKTLALGICIVGTILVGLWGTIVYTWGHALPRGLQDV